MERVINKNMDEVTLSEKIILSLTEKLSIAERFYIWKLKRLLTAEETAELNRILFRLRTVPEMRNWEDAVTVYTRSALVKEIVYEYGYAVSQMPENGVWSMYNSNILSRFC